MSQAVQVEIEVPDGLSGLRLPAAVQRRLQDLLDQQDRGEPLSTAEREEAEGLVELTEFLTLLRLRSIRLATE
jgi:hypothetical protein